MGKHPLKGAWSGAYDPELMKAEAIASDFLEEFWWVGKANERNITVDDVDPYELEIGTKIEMEHTDSQGIAARIALDHLAEHPDYYHGLNFMETLLEAGALQAAIEIVREELGL